MAVLCSNGTYRLNLYFRFQSGFSVLASKLAATAQSRGPLAARLDDHTTTTTKNKKDKTELI
jgi:hypothetical protein